jgi:hypothetical protein
VIVGAGSGGLSARAISRAVSSWATVRGVVRVDAHRGDVVGVGVAVDDVGDRLVGDLGDRRQDLVGQRRRGVDRDHPGLGHQEDHLVQAVADQVQVVADLLDQVALLRDRRPPGRLGHGGEGRDPASWVPRSLAGATASNRRSCPCGPAWGGASLLTAT